MKILFTNGIGGFSETEGYDVPETDTNPLILRYAVENGQLVDKFPGQTNEAIIAADKVTEAAKALEDSKSIKIDAYKQRAYTKILVINTEIEKANLVGDSTVALVQQKADVKTALASKLSDIQNATTQEDLQAINLVLP